MYEAGAPEAFRPYPLQYKVKKQSPATPQQMKYLKQFVEFHGIPMPEIYEDASRSEISRLTDQLIAQYGKMKKNHPCKIRHSVKCAAALRWQISS